MTNHFDFKGQVAVVTGGAGGIGEAISAGLAQAGAAVVITSRKTASIQGTAERIQAAGGRAAAVACDVANPQSVQQLADQVMGQFGRVDILVNVAGLAVRQPTVSFELEKWQQVMDINVKGTFLCCQAFGRVMVEQKRGSIVNISSVKGRYNQVAGYAAYSPSKAAVDTLTRALAVEWAPQGVRVNAVAPTFVATPLAEEMLKNPEFVKGLLARIPMGRIGTPQDVVGPVLFLASEAAAFVTGQVLYVDGGLTSA